ncbi:uncharacterized protein LOC9328618 [Arabidopsis lyrata subsp. lyrata]|uniref:uncharacterized protein LOC9328618 n=1 Tax=Arabidopsis lyrata subsp. lyrata TaxID=81972 RepID=UPI000A29B285|nr:uncharacterized protein LOC9328618 [Arabidopsis lyrata subsp. lyrata]|eukprot:XP_020866773.1 uncharacterized protein LOC9328618 [Arabidopsis lyrata subsp. lyrata]
MQGLATSTDRISLSFLGPRNQSKTHTKPTRVCFSNDGSFPKSRISRQILPLLANDFASSLSFAYDRRLPRRVTASADDNSSITTVAENRLQNRLFMVYCCLGFMWMVKNESLPRYFRFHMTMGLLLDALEYLPWININGKLIRMYYTMLVMGLSFTHLLIDFVYWWFLPILVCIAVVVAIIFTELFTLLGFS